MDDQHAVLMDTMNDLRLALMRGSDRENAGEILYRLIEFTRMHFQSEERLMEQSDFPGLSEHRAAHQGMMAQMRQSPHHVLHGNAAHVRSLLGSLREGYLQHIETLVQQYGPWLNERGLR
jgi:hemerythrin